MSRTTTNHDCKNINKFALPYAALDDGSFVRLPAPAAGHDEIIVGAQGVVSSVGSLLKLSTHWLSSDFQESLILRDHYYSLGILRVDLSGNVGGGCNGRYGKLPTTQPGNKARRLFFHYGSTAGYSCYATMITKLDISFVVLTNLIGLADPSIWVNELLTTTLTDSPSEIDFISLAKDAARNHVAAYPARDQ